MLQRLLFFTGENLYDSKRRFTHQLARSLKRLGVAAQVVEAGGRRFDQTMIETLKAYEPRATLSYHQLLPNSQGRHLWDFLGCPHGVLSVDPAIHLVGLAKNPALFFTCVDEQDLRLLTEQCHAFAFLLPHAIDDALLSFPLAQEKLYDVLFLGSYYDYHAIEEAWEEKIRAPLGEVGKRVALQELSLEGAMLELLSSAVLSREDPIANFLFDIDLYARGWHRARMVEGVARALSKQVLHIFGGPGCPGQKMGWEKECSGMANVQLHPKVDYFEGLKILSQSRVVLSSMPFFPHGSHERVFNAVAAGSWVVSTPSTYLQSRLEGKGLATVEIGEFTQFGEVAGSLVEEKEDAPLRSGQEWVREHATWKVRAQKLYEALCGQKLLR